MALSSSTLSAEIKSNIEACFGPAADDDRLQCFCDALADAIVTRIVADAVVQPGSFSNAGGAVTGTGTIT